MISIKDKPSGIIQDKSASKIYSKDMLISNIYVDNDDQLLETSRKNNFIANALGAHFLLGFDDAWLFDTPRINNHIVNAPSSLIILCNTSAQLFETPTKKNGVTASSAQKNSGSD